MKIPLIVFLFALGIAVAPADPLASTGQTPVPTATDYAITQQDGNSRDWQRTTYETGPNGASVARIHKFTELATGLNHLVDGQWVESKDEIDILSDGTAAATNGQHQVYFPSDIYSGQIRMVTPEGMELKSQPVGLSYDDGSNTVFIAVLTNSVGQLLSSNQVIYPNAFSGVNADLVYTYTKAGFEQDVILRTQPPAPATFNLNPDNTRLQVLTEFFNPAEPSISTSTLSAQAGTTLDDQTLDFGVMQMVPGKAFVLGKNSPAVQVAKSWVGVGGRQFLLEQVPVAAMADELESLPPTTAQALSALVVPSNSRNLILPVSHLAKASPQPMKLMAMNSTSKKGVVLDYVTQNTSLTNYTFQGDLTYYISGTIYLYGTNTFEGGSVLKYASGVAVYAYQTGHATAVKWLASAYRPVIFTAKDDNTIGETISGSTGSPSGYYATYALNFYENSTPISYFRVAYAQKGFSANYGTDSFSNGQFVNCLEGVEDYADTLKLRNLLFENVQTNINAIFLGAVDAQNVTFSGSAYLIPSITYGSLSLTNCILANVSSLTNSMMSSTITGEYNGFYNSPAFGLGTTTVFYPFKKVGGGSYYLTNGCAFIGAGTANIDPILLAQLGQKTVYPPTVYSNQPLHSILTLGLVVPRDTNATPSLGYHYDPLDYVFGGCDLYTNLTFTAGTAVGWFENQGGVSSSGQPYGISLNTGANFTEIGTATAPCYLVRYETVQEGYNGNWNNRGWMSGLMVNGNGSSPLPQINAQFTKWMVSAEMCNLFRDNWNYGEGTFADCEFYAGGMATYDQSFLRYTNCLFFRNGIYFNGYGQSIATSATFQDCTFYNGFLSLNRYAGQPANMWIIENTVFDGTGFSTTDNLNGNTNYTQFNYNAYNTNNLSGFSYPYPYTPVPTNYLETIGANDVKTTNYNWQASWFGNYYLPTNSVIINKGSTTANALGFYYFTTQTNQTIEGDSQADIGYHYVATDSSGIPLASFNDGIPDYLDDPNGNGLPNWWLLEYFGSLNESATDLDILGNTLLDDYTYGNYPNFIAFTASVTNSYVKQMAVPVQLGQVSGAPSFYAVLVNDTNYTDAIWTSYIGTNITANLGSTNGIYNVWVGLKGSAGSAFPTWDITDLRLILHLQVPTLAIISPTNRTVSQPIIQLQGFANESLSQITYDISNAAGIFTNQTGYSTGLSYDTNQLAYTTNYFQCYDIPLNNGTNIITLHAIDLAGNSTTTNFTYTLSYSADTNPPILKLVWPQPNALIGGSNFTLQASVDDDNASVIASISGTNGITNVMAAVIERNGNVWVNGVPLAGGTNRVTLTATDAAGNVNTTNFSVVKSSVNLTINPLSSDQLNQPLADVGGTVTVGQNVYVNGIQASVDGSGNWSATNVPVNPNGMAMINVGAGSATNAIIGSQTLNQVQPVTVQMSSYDAVLDSSSTYFGACGGGDGISVFDDTSIHWMSGGGGFELVNGDSWDGNCGDPIYPSTGDYDLSSYTNGLAQSWVEASLSTAYPATTIQAQTSVAIQPSGLAQIGQSTLYLVESCWKTYSEPEFSIDRFSGDTPMPPTALQIMGQNLVNTGITNLDGAVWGATIISAPSGVKPSWTPTVNQSVPNNEFSFTNQVFQIVSQCVATTPSNQARTNLGVGEQVVIFFNPSPYTNITWSATSGSIAMTNGFTNLFTAPLNVTNVTVTAKVGSYPVYFNYQIFAPTGYANAQIVSTNAFLAGQAAVEMHLSVTIGPTNVSFYQVQLEEVGEYATNVTGYFTNFLAADLFHGTANEFVLINTNNSLPNGDECQIGPLTAPPPVWTAGGFTWPIPVNWKVGSSSTNSMNGWSQIFSMDNNATITIQKFGHGVTRNTNNIITTY